MSERARVLRWDLWLPAAAVVIALALVLLAATAADALRQRHNLVVDGRVLHLAHDLERRLRETGPEGAEGVLRAALEREHDFLVGLAVYGSGSRPELRVGAAPAGEVRNVEVFVGPAWHFGARSLRPEPRGPGLGGLGGRRVLELALEPASLRPPAVTRLLVPGAGIAGVVLLALSLLGGRLLVRQREEQRREGERRSLEGLARAGAGLAHQLRTPLATIKGSCQLLLERAVPGTEKRLRTILEQSERMDRLLSDLLDYARPPEPEAREVPLAPLLAELTEMEPRVRVGPARDLVVHADPEHLRHVLANLVANAVEHSPPEAPVDVEAELRGSRVEVRVADRGPGPGEDPERLFEPYVTSRAAGTGLGLPIARALAQANGGAVTLATRSGGGSVAVVSLEGAGEGGR